MSAASTPLIACRNVSFGYGAASIVRGLDLDINAGELCGIIGPNGAGKSTLVRLLLGLVAPNRGSITVAGAEVSSLPPRRRALLLAAVLQEEPLDFPFTALEVVLLGRLARLPPMGFERANDVAVALAAMRETGVAALADRPMLELSGGERKRVLLARALAQEPRALVLDEPTAALDIQHQLEIFARLKERQRAGVAVVVVVHDLNLASAFCDKLVLLHATQPPVVGTPAEVLTETRLRDVFGVDMVAVAHPLSGARVLLPQLRRPSD
jgi:iron complex transport system ATP-binding protein